MTIVFKIFSLLILYQLKHFVADYLLQGKYMIRKFSPGWDFVLPLAAHAGVHGLFTLWICLNFAPYLWWLALVDFVVHFVMDRIKAGPKYLGRFKALSGTEYLNVMQDEHMARLMDDKESIKNAKTKFRHNVFFWWSLGFDQMIHNLTHYFIIFMIVLNG